MYQCFTARARKALQLANQEAHRLNHDYVGTEHLLLGLMKDGYGIGFRILNQLRVTLALVRAEVEKTAPRHFRSPTTGKLPRTAGATAAVQYAATAALKLHDDHVNTGHLLLGLLCDEGPGGQLLCKLGLDLEMVLERLREVMVNTPEPEEEFVGYAPPGSAR